MKNSTMNLMIAAAALVVAAGSASAQTFKAEIPMFFRVGETFLEPGPYQIKVATGTSTQVSVLNLDTHRSVLLIPGSKTDAPKGWRKEGRPKIGFECSGSTCTLNRLWDGQNSLAYAFQVRKLPTVEARKVDVVTLGMTKVH